MTVKSSSSWIEDLAVDLTGLVEKLFSSCIDERKKRLLSRTVASGSLLATDACCA